MAETAPRPHRLTIYLSLLSPILAVVATIVSIMALRSTQESAQISQRAYLGFTLERATIERLTTPSGVRNLKFLTDVQVKNLGNTPAYVDKADESYLVRSGARSQTRTFPRLVPDIAPRDSFRQSGFNIMEENDLSPESGTTFVRYLLRIDWHDVFRGRHKEQWCIWLSWDKGDTDKITTKPCDVKSLRASP